MATNDDGHLVDSKGNVVVDFVWGNLPIQGNDDRTIQPILGTSSYGTNLDFSLDNHVIVESGWNGYPLYTPNNAGTISNGVAYLIFPTIYGDTVAVATDNLYDAGFATVTNGTAATNTAKNITRTNVTSTTSATIYATGADTAYPVGSVVTIQAGTASGSVHLPASLIGNWTVTATGSGYITISGTGWTVADTTSISDTGQLKGKTGTIGTYTLASGNTTNQTTASTITINAWA